MCSNTWHAPFEIFYYTFAGSQKEHFHTLHLLFARHIKNNEYLTMLSSELVMEELAAGSNFIQYTVLKDVVF